MADYLTGAISDLTDQRAAISKAAGLPVRGVVIGGPDTLPKTFSPGVPGWTEHACAPVIDAGDGTGAIQVPDEARRHLGTRVRVDDKDVELPAEGTLISVENLPQKIKDKLPDASSKAALGEAGKGGT